MTKNLLLPKGLASKIAKATKALLILQWAHRDTLTHHTNVTDRQRNETRHELCYWLAVVVDDSEPRSTLELMEAARLACQKHCSVCAHIYRRKEALRKLKTNAGDFAAVYRLGYLLYNADRKAFPLPGYARKNNPLIKVKPVPAFY